MNKITYQRSNYINWKRPLLLLKCHSVRRLLLITSVLAGSWALLPVSAGAQKSVSPEKMRSFRQLDSLKQGLLLIVIPTDHKKIARLKADVADPDISGRQRQYLQKQLDETLLSQERTAQNLARAFREFYTFSDYRLITDTIISSQPLHDDQAYFLSADLKQRTTETLGSTYYFYLTYGFTDANTTTGIEALIIRNQQRDPLRPPFPYYARFKSIFPLFALFQNNEESAVRRMDKAVQRLNKRLEKFEEEMEESLRGSGVD